MPERRLVLPRERPGVNDFQATPVARTVDAADGGAPVVLVVPSVTRLVQAAWLRSLRGRPRRGFATWLDRELSTTPEEPEWGYDRDVVGWVHRAGAGRVHVVAGEDAAAVESVLGGIAGEPVSVRAWRRRLAWPEVAGLERLVDQLAALELTGRNATELVRGSIRALVDSAPPDDPGESSPLTAQQEHLLKEQSESMLTSVVASGARLHGDRSALLWRAATGRFDEPMALESAVRLSLGVLDRVAAWGAEERGA